MERREFLYYCWVLPAAVALARAQRRAKAAIGPPPQQEMAEWGVPWQVPWHIAADPPIDAPEKPYKLHFPITQRSQ